MNASSSGTFKIGGELAVNRLGFGAMRITGKGIWGKPANLDEARRVLKRAVELKINFIDTADSYGPNVSEELIGETLAPYPKGVVIATKVGLVRPGPDVWTMNAKPEHIFKAVEGSLARLKLKQIELYQLHRIDPKTPLADTIGALKDLQKSGKIRHLGLSVVSISDIKRVGEMVEVVAVQNLYNFSDRKHEDVLEYCEKNKIGFIPWFPLATGSLAQNGSPLSKIAAKYKVSPGQIALAWLLRKSPVMLPIPGTSTVAHLEENVAAAELKLSDDDFKTLDSLK